MLLFFPRDLPFLLFVFLSEKMSYVECECVLLDRRENSSIGNRLMGKARNAGIRAEFCVIIDQWMLLVATDR